MGGFRIIHFKSAGQLTKKKPLHENSPFDFKPAAASGLWSGLKTMRQHKRKRLPSAHQKQIRFFIGLFTVLIMLFTFLLFWFMNWLAYHNPR